MEYKKYWHPKHKRGHVWKKDSNGRIDIFGYDVGNHNGPVCVLCGYGFCHHCREIPAIECPKSKKELK